jgi:hypothetical protein
MPPDVTIIVQRRNGRYVFIARPYGVVVQADDLAAGLKELEERVQVVAKEYREAGVDPAAIAASHPLEIAEQQTGRQAPFWNQYLPFFVKTAVVVAVIAVLLQIQLALMSQYFGPGSTVGFIEHVLRHPVQFTIQLGEKADQVPPARSEELKLAIRKIGSKIGPLIEEFRHAVAQSAAPAASGSAPTGGPQPSR